MTKTILLATTGESPQVVTETLYAIHQQQGDWPAEIFLITTTVGRKRAVDGLINDGHLQRLCDEIERPMPRFDLNHVWVVPNAKGEPVEDARSLEDHQALGDFIMTKVRDLTQNGDAGDGADTRLHASLAGGRKTMTFYLGYAMSLFGRHQDRLTHVLVNKRCYEGASFWFPSLARDHRYVKDVKGEFIRDEFGNPADASQAEITLADIPFIRHRAELPKILLSKSERLEFSRLVDLFNLAADPEDLTVTIDIDEAEIVVASDRYRIRETFTPAPLDLAMYLLFARSHLAGTEIRRPAKGSADGHLLREYLQELLPLLGLPVMAEDEATLDGLERIEHHQDQSFDNEVRVAGKTLQALKGDQSNMDNFRGVGITQSWFDNRRTELRKAFSERLPEPLANWLLPSADTKGGDYGLPLEKRQLVIR
ncbi:MAG: TIGR02584 family CRISPR-associated protein [Corallincola sp.]|nr:TIGR02584 family CRISPR-associated protein [Corallincola sp.]